MSFYDYAERRTGVFYILYGESQEVIGRFETKQEARDKAKQLKLKKYLIEGIYV